MKDLNSIEPKDNQNFTSITNNILKIKEIHTMKIKIILFLSLVVFNIHNIEEYLTLNKFYHEHIDKFPSFAKVSENALVNGLFGPTVGIINLIAIAMILLSFALKKKFYIIGLIWIIGGLFANGLHHILISTVFFSYSPGFITSLLLLIPFSIYVIITMFKDKLIFKKDLIIGSITGILIMAPVILISEKIAEFIVNFSK